MERLAVFLQAIMRAGREKALFATAVGGFADTAAFAMVTACFYCTNRTRRGSTTDEPKNPATPGSASVRAIHVRSEKLTSIMHTVCWSSRLVVPNRGFLQ